MTNKYIIIVCMLLGFSGPGYSQFLNVTANPSVAVLMQNLLGGGIQISSPSGQTQHGCGLFTNNGIVQIPYTYGVIMSTGSLNEIQINDTASFTNSTDFGIIGDPLLNVISAPLVTYDAQYIEFDFIASSDTVILEFLFASEEYNEKVNQITTDLFRVFVSGPGYPNNTNMSVIPGTQIPIGINTINNGQSAGTSTGPCINCDKFIDNVGTAAVDLAFDGYTNPFLVKIGVNVCASYHIKITIADVFDGYNDSFILLKGNGFRTQGNIPIFINGNAFASNDTLYICQGGNITLSLPNGPSYGWSTGDTTQSITVNQPGTYQAYIIDPLTGCFAFTSSITLISQGTIQTPVIVQNGNSLSAPNLIPSPVMLFQWNLNGNPIPGATQSTFTIPGNGCYTLTIFEGPCQSTSNIICITNTSLNEINSSLIKIIPHPVTHTSIIETPFDNNSNTTMRLFDVTGRMIFNENQQGKIISISKQGIPGGIYFLEITNSEFKGSIMKKIVFQ